LLEPSPALPSDTISAGLVAVDLRKGDIMHRSEWEQGSSCVGCGAEVGATDRVFALADGVVLCLGCALARNGAYDEVRDAWTTLPRVDDLAQYLGD